MKRGTPDHPKMKELARRLGTSRSHAVGIMATLWDWASKYTPAGDVGKYSNPSIAEQVDWKGDPDALVAAMIESRWLDALDSCRLFIHDWPDHCEDSVHAYLARNVMFFADEAQTRPSLKKLAIESGERAEVERKFKEAENKRLNLAAKSSIKAARKRQKPPALTLAFTPPSAKPEPLPGQAGPPPEPEPEPQPKPEPVSSSDERDAARRSRGEAPAPRSAGNGDPENPPELKRPRVVSVVGGNCTLEIAGELQTIPLAEAEKLLAAKGVGP